MFISRHKVVLLTAIFNVAVCSCKRKGDPDVNVPKQEDVGKKQENQTSGGSPQNESSRKTGDSSEDFANTQNQVANGSETHGGDPTALLVDSARKDAAYIMDHLKPHVLAEMQDQEIAAKILKRADDMARDIRQARHLWTSVPQERCAQTANTRWRSITFSTDSCKATIKTRRDAVTLLLHEAVHRIGIADEDTADEFANLAYEAILSGRFYAEEFSGPSFMIREDPMAEESAVWTGNEMVIASHGRPKEKVEDLVFRFGAYNPKTSKWRQLPSFTYRSHRSESVSGSPLQFSAGKLVMFLPEGLASLNFEEPDAKWVFFLRPRNDDLELESVTSGQISGNHVGCLVVKATGADGTINGATSGYVSRESYLYRFDFVHEAWDVTLLYSANEHSIPSFWSTIAFNNGMQYIWILEEYWGQERVQNRGARLYSGGIGQQVSPFKRADKFAVPSHENLVVSGSSVFSLDPLYALRETTVDSLEIYINDLGTGDDSVWNLLELSPRRGAALTSMSNSLYMWGGFALASSPMLMTHGPLKWDSVQFSTLYELKPKTKSIRAISSLQFLKGRLDPIMMSTGSEILVWGGRIEYPDGRQEWPGTGLIFYPQ